LIRPKLAISSPRRNLYIYRSVINIVGMYLWIKALTSMPMNDATAIGYLTPIFASIGAVWVLNEKFERYHLVAMLGGLLGMIIILQPTGDILNNVGIIYAVSSAIAWAVNDVICKVQTTHDSLFSQLFLLFAFGSLITFPLAVFHWQAITMKEISALMECSFIALLNISVLFLALSKAPLTLLMPLSFARLIFMAIGSYIIFEETLKFRTVFGSVFIILSSMYLVYATNKKQEKPMA